MELPTLAGALASLKLAADAAKGLLSERDDRLVTKVIGDMNDRMMDVQNQCLVLLDKQCALAESERQLKEKLRKMEEKAADLDQYELHQNTHGAVMYRSKVSLDPSDKPVYLCANCMAAGIKTFLQFQSRGLKTMLFCKEHGDVRSDIPDRKMQPVRIAF